jgi:hypothetical protein
MSDHDLELVSPLYGSKGSHTAFCTCGWASDEVPTAGQATIAGYQHIRDTRRVIRDSPVETTKEAS